MEPEVFQMRELVVEVYKPTDKIVELALAEVLSSMTASVESAVMKIIAMVVLVVVDLVVMAILAVVVAILADQVIIKLLHMAAVPTTQAPIRTTKPV